MDDNRKAVIYALAACLVWGTVYAAVRAGLDHGMRPITFAGIRFLTSGLLLTALAWALGRMRMSRRDLLVTAAFGLVQTGVQNALFFTGVDLTSAGISAIFINTAPFFVILMAPLFFRGSGITFPRLAGVTVGFGGVLLTTYRHGVISGHFEAGVLALVLSAIVWAVSNIAAKKLMEGRDTLAFTAVQMTAGAAPLLAAGYVIEGNTLSGVDAAGWLILAYLVLFATAVPFFAWFKAIRLGEVGRVSVFLFVLPVLGVLSGWLLLGEPVNAGIFVGMAMVALGIIMVNRG